jgi:hypothetical protein
MPIFIKYYLSLAMKFCQEKFEASGGRKQICFSAGHSPRKSCSQLFFSEKEAV